MTLYLASSSPRRRELLSMLIDDFKVMVADVDETPLENECPGDLVIRLARLKAQTVYDLVANRRGEAVRVLGGDTVVAINNMILGKPSNAEDAKNMLAQLSNQTHTVYSGVALCHGIHGGDGDGDDDGDGDGNHSHSLLSKTQVTFKPLTAQIIDDYCHTPDPYDKAGAYGIQGGAGCFVSKLEGSYTGVVGLPLWHVHQLLFATNLLCKANRGK